METFWQVARTIWKVLSTPLATIGETPLSVAGILLACLVLAAGSILYNTSNVLHHYRTDQHVAAALNLFASFALLLYYVLMILSSRR